MADLVLVDTCVLLDDPDVLRRISRKGGRPFLSSTVLDELDFNKKRNEQVGRNVRLLFREFAHGNKAPMKQLHRLPNGMQIREADSLTTVSFKGEDVFLIGRSSFRSASNNDAKIVEIAKDYGMHLITRDNAMKIRAQAEGVVAEIWRGPHAPESEHDQRLPERGTPKLHVRPFALPSDPIAERDSLLAPVELPRAGMRVRTGSKVLLTLGPVISEGGEGTIYEISEDPDVVCKVYRAQSRTELRERKIRLMLTRPVRRPGICWPIDVITTASGAFVGYVMPRAGGRTLQSTVFVKPRLQKSFPTWTRRDLINVANTFLEQVEYLHHLNVLIGDINPLNLLVAADSRHLWLVDTDSFQVERFPCSVGTVNFTAPEIQGRRYGEFLRTKDHELFAVATMLFMILLPGKPPYSQQGGGSPEENIRSQNFPYRYVRDWDNIKQEEEGRKAPEGPWQFIWSNLPNRMREAFVQTFRENRRLDIPEWKKLLSSYSYELEHGRSSGELFPLSFRIRDPEEAICSLCSQTYRASGAYLAKLALAGKHPICPACLRRMKTEKLAMESERNTRQISSVSRAPKPAAKRPAPVVKPRPVAPFPGQRAAPPQVGLWHFIKSLFD